ncbi:hypothetical protein F2Q69_00042408 [Brassica cretica]|uniref:CCHC-type domain-containing protein n=1 Tax=Brassica cretica TaxID=69181 RepID=A0A8S9NT27_BRACR|nr:hypothetical protein F2Q69_00042408 [Brassica cretica]
MFEYIRTTVMGWLALHRAKANREQGTLTPNVRKLVEENYEFSTVGGVEIGVGTPNDLLPPAVRRPPGRPRKVRILSHGEYKKGGNSSSRKCKRCCRSGHNKASCRNPI